MYGKQYLTNRKVIHLRKPERSIIDIKKTGSGFGGLSLYLDCSILCHVTMDKLLIKFQHSIQFSSAAESYMTFCDPRDCSTPCFPLRHRLPELTQTHVHWVGDGMQHPHLLPSVVPFSSCLQSFPASGSFPVSQFFASVAKVLEFQLQHQSFQWIFRTDFL